MQSLILHHVQSGDPIADPIAPCQSPITLSKLSSIYFDNSSMEYNYILRSILAPNWTTFTRIPDDQHWYPDYETTRNAFVTPALVARVSSAKHEVTLHLGNWVMPLQLEIMDEEGDGTWETSLRVDSIDLEGLYAY